jgi:hypothetical protein
MLASLEKDESMYAILLLMLLLVVLFCFVGLRFLKRKAVAENKGAFFICPTCGVKDCDCHRVDMPSSE